MPSKMVPEKLKLRRDQTVPRSKAFLNFLRRGGGRTDDEASLKQSFPNSTPMVEGWATTQVCIFSHDLSLEFHT